MNKPLAPELIERIRCLAETGLPSRRIAAELGISQTTVLNYANRPVPRPPFTPLYDPHRDGAAEQNLTARLCGDPAPGRRELVERHDPVRQRPSR